ncbi:MAG: Crp/Fnr family transcriptional regulator [Bacteroidota bacterium]
MELTNSLRSLFPFPAADFLAELEAEGQVQSIPPETTILRTGGTVGSLPVILDGQVKVFLRHEDKDLLLYYIEPGESCIMSFAACVHSSGSEVSAVTETEAKVLLLPAEKIAHWLRAYPSFGQFMLEVYHARYLDLLHTMEQLIFQNLDERVLSYLQKKSSIQQQEELQITHQHIAQDLGTAREVISRILRKMEKDGKIITSRNRIKLPES